jgi:hypothetical protein
MEIQRVRQLKDAKKLAAKRRLIALVKLLMKLNSR